MSASMRQLHPDVESILYDEPTLQSKCVELGGMIAKEYADLKPLLMVTVTGAYMFASDLAKCITPVPDGMQIDFVRASSYGAGTVSSGEVKIQDCSRISVSGRHVIVIEDIVDTGGTLDKLITRMTDMGALSVKVAALLNKEARRKVEVPVHFEGFKCQDSFVVGYGMDYDEDYRTLPYVGILKPHVYLDD
eukprot:jgi/Ulvmu1/5361/UM022_0155.1